jgi:hypothetical protein
MSTATYTRVRTLKVGDRAFQKLMLLGKGTIVSLADSPYVNFVLDGHEHNKPQCINEKSLEKLPEITYIEYKDYSLCSLCGCSVISPAHHRGWHEDLIIQIRNR